MITSADRRSGFPGQGSAIRISKSVAVLILCAALGGWPLGCGPDTSAPVPSGSSADEEPFSSEDFEDGKPGDLTISAEEGEGAEAPHTEKLEEGQLPDDGPDGS